MSISKTMEEAINSNNITVIRSSFYTIVLSDPGFTTGRFEQALQYVKSRKVPGLIDAHDNTEFRGESEWDEDYCSLLASELQDNFSLERIDHLIKVSKKVYQTAERTGTRTAQNAANKAATKTKAATKETEAAEEHVWLKRFAIVAGLALFIKWIFKEEK